MKNTIFCGEASAVLTTFLEGSIDLVVTSPPYDDLRSYNGYTFDAVPVLKALYRVLKPGGVIVWVVGDATVKGRETGTSFRQALAAMDVGFWLHDTMIYEKNTSSFPAKRNGLRCTQIFEYMFVFSKGKPKTVNLICDKKNRWAGTKNWGKQTARKVDGTLAIGQDHVTPEFSPRNNIWRYDVGAGFGQKDKEAYDHPATFPMKLALDHVTQWSNKGDVVLDPMCGSGTTCIAAKILGRSYVGIDISSKYADLAKHRLAKS